MASSMCGICAEIALDGSDAHLGSVEKMLHELSPRGPDASGAFRQGRLAVGHRRLKVIDLTEKASQPMLDPELGLGISFNGCIYNYKELRKELEAKSYSFFSSGDTEVILKAYHAWGDDCVKHFNGMFAFIIWERDSGRIFMARDRLGIKPLYYAEVDGKLRIASSLPALVKSGGISTEIDSEALNFYMSFHSVVPAPWTILKSVRKLPPASRMIIEPAGEIKINSYWQLNFETVSKVASRKFEDWKIEIAMALKESMKRRMMADVAVGVLLSGGLDSSLIVGLLDAMGQRNLHTFSIGFESEGGEKGDEFEYSDVIAKHFKTDHHRIFINSKEVIENLQKCIEAMSEPMVSHDVIGFYLLSREVKKHIKVVQSGQGADEVFAGYHWYPPLLETKNLVDDYSRVFLDRDFPEYKKAITSPYIGEDYSQEFIREHFVQKGADLAINKALRLDTTVMLVDDPVKRVDNMTMAWGLEARVPFLDHELVELAAQVPVKWKVGNGGKYILKEVARQFIPDSVIDRPKGYFPVPALKFLKGSYLERVKDVLTSKAATNRALFNHDYINGILKNPDEHITPLRGSKLWQMALLEEWFQVHKL